MRLSDMGEFALIARLTEGLGSRPDVALGVGDDTAALDLGADQLLLATCDAQVEGSHFLTRIATPQEIGHKALAVNLSDIAAMGGEPLWALVSLLVSPDMDVATLEGVYEGMRSLARRYQVALVGGNVASTSGPFSIDITLMGRAPRDHLITRAGARPGDSLLVTGSLGAGVTAFLALTTNLGTSASASEHREALAAVRARMVAPQPRVEEGRALAATGAVTAMLDVSDGLAGDLGHICERSHVGALVDASALPIDAAARTIAEAMGRDPVALALAGGDDYELLFTTRPEDTARVTGALRALGTDVTVIGEITTADLGLRVRFPDGQTLPLAARSWDHLRPHSDDALN